MDTVRLNIENFQPRNLPMEMQEQTSSPRSADFTAREWNKYSSDIDGISVEDAWLVSFKAEVSELLGTLEETQKKIQAEILAHRWICKMESRLEVKRNHADMLDEYEREEEVEHRLEMERLKQVHQRLQGLKEEKSGILVECAIVNIEEANLADMKQVHQRLQGLKEENNGSKPLKIECMASIEEANLAEESNINAKRRKGRSTGCFGFFKNLFRRSKSKTKTDKKTEQREDSS